MNELKLQDAILRAGPRLALGMLHKLSVHAAKGPWDQKTIGELVHGLDEEVAELKAALAGGHYPEILDECADVANYCLMIADWAANLGPPPPERVREAFQARTPVLDGDTGEQVGQWEGMKFVTGPTIVPELFNSGDIVPPSPPQAPDVPDPRRRRGHCGYISGGGIRCVREFGHGDGHSFGEQ